MIPPTDPTLLETNPQFAFLYKHVTTQLLNPDASTRSISTSHNPVAKRLRQHHVQAAKYDILRRSLYSLTVDESLPSELVELVLNIATYLSEAPTMNLSPEAHALMVPEVEEFQDNLHTIAPLLSKDVQEQRDSLLPLTVTSSSPTKPVKSTSSLSLASTLSTRLTSLHALQTQTLPVTNTALSNTLSTLLHAHTTHLAALIRHLELHTHGTQSRHTHARATYLSTVAAGLEAKVQVLALQARHAVYTPTVQRALVSYSSHLQDFREKLREREEMLKSELDLYEDVGGDGLKECARRYGVVAKEIEVVKGEIARLEGERRVPGRRSRA
jgi:diphthamide biosynthesis protein 3